jgi:hypothetical protein
MRTRLVWITIALAACTRFEPTGSEAMEPPPDFREWWSKTQACSGLEGNFDRVRWFVVPGHEFACPSGQCVGHWEPDHRIYIAEDWVDNEMVARHEMLHDLIGHPGHPDPPFGSPCPLTWSTWTGSGAPPVEPFGRSDID